MLQSAGLNSFYLSDGEFVNVDVLDLLVTRKNFKRGHRRGIAICKLKVVANLIYSEMNEELAAQGITDEKIRAWIKDAMS